MDNVDLCSLPADICSVLPIDSDETVVHVFTQLFETVYEKMGSFDQVIKSIEKNIQIEVNRSSAEILRHNVNSEKSIHELHNICENVEKLSKNYESTVSQLLTPYNKLSYEIEFSDRLIDAEELLKTLQRFIILFKKYVALEAAGAAMHDMLKSTVSELISLLFSPDTQLYKLQAIMDRRKVLELRAAQLNISIPILN